MTPPDSTNDQSGNRTDDDVRKLLDVDRELTPDEREAVGQLGARAMDDLLTALRLRAQTAYSPTSVTQFSECVLEHLDPTDRANLVVDDMYSCPKCGRLLKDRP